MVGRSPARSAVQVEAKFQNVQKQPENLAGAEREGGFPLRDLEALPTRGEGGVVGGVVPMGEGDGGARV